MTGFASVGGVPVVDWQGPVSEVGYVGGRWTREAVGLTERRRGRVAMRVVGFEVMRGDWR